MRSISPLVIQGSPPVQPQPHPHCAGGEGLGCHPGPPIWSRTGTRKGAAFQTGRRAGINGVERGLRRVGGRKERNEWEGRRREGQKTGKGEGRREGERRRGSMVGRRNWWEMEERGRKLQCAGRGWTETVLVDTACPRSWGDVPHCPTICEAALPRNPKPSWRGGHNEALGDLAGDKVLEAFSPGNPWPRDSPWPSPASKNSMRSWKCERCVECLACLAWVPVLLGTLTALVTLT